MQLNLPFYKRFSIVIFMVTFLNNAYSQNACPQFGDLLDKGWGEDPQQPHIPLRGNMDEFAITDANPFMVKAGNYPPVKSFPIIPYSGCSSNTFYYFSFDTDFNFLPINYRLPRQEESIQDLQAVFIYTNYE